MQAVLTRIPLFRCRESRVSAWILAVSSWRLPGGRCSCNAIPAAEVTDFYFSVDSPASPTDDHW